MTWVISAHPAFIHLTSDPELPYHDGIGLTSLLCDYIATALVVRLSFPV
jgi:hypothetical protein